MKGFILSLALLLLFTNIATAQKTKKDSIKTENLKEIVVTAQYAPTSEKNAVYKVKIISKKQIQEKAVTNLTDLLRQELHLNFSFNPAFGAGIEINGISKENIKILIDGVPLIGRVNGVLNLNQINLNNIERIEIIEGPVSVFYGTDAMGGIINLITNKTQNKTVTGDIAALYETIENKNIYANIGLKDGKSLFKFVAGYTYFNGINTNIHNKRSLNWPKKRQYDKHFKFVQSISNFNLMFSSDYSNELLHTLGEIKHGKATDIDYTTSRFDNSLNLQGKLNKNNYLDFTISYLNYDRFDTWYKFISDTNTATLIKNNPNENRNYFDTFFTKIQFANSNKERMFNYVIGTEYQIDYGKGNRILDYKQQVKNVSLYASVNYKITHNFEIQPAVRYTKNNVFGDLFSPAFNAKFQFNNQHNIRFAYGNGFRAPSIKELYLDWSPTFGPFTYIFLGNKNLKLESSNSYNLYYTYSENNLYLESSICYNEIKDLIGLSDMVHFERHFINLNKMKSINISVQSKLKYIKNLQINLGASYLGRYIEYTDTFNSDTFMFTPSANASISYNYKSFLKLNLFYKYSGKQKGHFIDDSSGSDQLVETTRKDFSNMDFSVSKTFIKQKSTIQIGIKNIFNITDIETFNQIGVAHERNNQLLGSSYFLKVTYKF
jgi:outer membrane receptor for ferrienterochelin and colicins